MVTRFVFGTALSLTWLVGCSSAGGSSDTGGHTGGGSGGAGGSGSGGSSSGDTSGSSSGATGGSSSGGGTGMGSGASGSGGATGQPDADAGGDSSAAAGGTLGGDAAGGGIDADMGDSSSVSAGGFSLTSTALPPGGMYLPENTCAGANTSPPFAWSGAPAATKSYAIAFRDNTHMTTRWVIWDIPATTTSLPAALAVTPDLTVPPGAKQVDWPQKGNGYGYAGPCPGTGAHIFEFTLYALNVAILPGVTTNSLRDDVRTVVIAHSIATATLAGTSSAVAKK
jgi:Raf kinase inhibitor-like YbhB/YbcL family protein